MHVTVEIVGEGTRDVDLADDARYADVARAVGYSPHEVSLLVDDSPVPADQPVDADHVRVLRLITGGSSADEPDSRL